MSHPVLWNYLTARYHRGQYVSACCRQIAALGEEHIYLSISEKWKLLAKQASLATFTYCFLWLLTTELYVVPELSEKQILPSDCRSISNNRQQQLHQSIIDTAVGQRPTRLSHYGLVSELFVNTLSIDCEFLSALTYSLSLSALSCDNSIRASLILQSSSGQLDFHTFGLCHSSLSILWASTVNSVCPASHNQVWY